MDEWSILDEVDAIAKWPSDQKKVVFEGGKWSERKMGLEALNKIMEDNPRLSTITMTIYGELMDELRKILDRETNIVVVCTACRTVELLAKGLRTKFGGFVGMVLPFLIKRAKDKKKNVRDAVSAALDAVSDTTTTERISKDLVDWFGISSPESKQTLLEFLYRYFIRMTSPEISFVKMVAPLMTKCASDSDVQVREKAYMAIGSLKRLIGEAIGAFLGPICGDNSKMEKVVQAEAKSREEWEKIQAERGFAAISGGADAVEGGERCEEAGSSKETRNEGEIDTWMMFEAVDVSKGIDKGVEGQLVDKNWKERLAGCEAVKKEVDSVGRVDISERLREIMGIMIKIIEKDVNVNVASCSAMVLTGIAQKSRFAFAPIVTKLMPVCFEKLKDKKQVLRDALNALLDSAATTTPLGAYIEAVTNALVAKNPQTRSQTAAFLARFFGRQDATTMEMDALKGVAESIAKVSNDADKEVREYATRCVAGVVKACGETVAKRLFVDLFEDNLKAEKIPAIVEEIEKESGKGASVEMKRLAKQYGIGSQKTTNSSKVPAKPAARPITANKVATRPVSGAPKSKPFVARPAPNFAAPKQPVISARPKSVTRTAPVKPTRPETSGSSKVITSRINMNGPSKNPVVPRSGIAPNVIRASSATRPNVEQGKITKPTRIAGPPNLSLSGIPRPGFSTRPLSRPASREVLSNIRPPSRGTT